MIDAPRKQLRIQHDGEICYAAMSDPDLPGGYFVQNLSAKDLIVLLRDIGAILHGHYELLEKTK